MKHDNRAATYLHVETDDEFIRRAFGGCHAAGGRTGAALDDFMWSSFKVQRRIVWDDGATWDPSKPGRAS